MQNEIIIVYWIISSLDRMSGKSSERINYQKVNITHNYSTPLIQQMNILYILDII